MFDEDVRLGGVAAAKNGAFVAAKIADRIVALVAASEIRTVAIVHEGEDVVVPEIQLGVESISTTVNAITMEDLAEQQIAAEEHQRILGVLPNFYVSYVPDAAPLTRKQKFKLAVVVSRDPVTFFTTGVTAGIEQWQGDFAGYGQEFSGYAKRYAASYGDKLSSTFLGAALLPSILHQDTRYYTLGKGDFAKRLGYAFSRVAVTRSDSGHETFNFSEFLGAGAFSGVANFYYPSQERTLTKTYQRWVTNLAIDSCVFAFKEVWPDINNSIFHQKD